MIALGLSFYGKLLALLNKEFIFSLRNHTRICLTDEFLFFQFNKETKKGIYSYLSFFSLVLNSYL